MHVQIPEESEHQTDQHELEIAAVGWSGEPEPGRTGNVTDSSSRNRAAPRERDQRREPQRHVRMRCREFARAALAADFGIARIRMPVRAEFEIVRPSAEVAEQRLAGGDSMALVAIAHRVFLNERVALIARRAGARRRTRSHRGECFQEWRTRKSCRWIWR